MNSNRFLVVSIAFTGVLTVAIVAAFATLVADATITPVQAATLTVAVLQIASVMVVATLALSRARTRLFGWESLAAATILTGFLIVAGAQGVGSDVAMVVRPPIGLIGILAFTLFDTGRPTTRIDRLVTVPASLIGMGLGVLIGITGTVTAGAWAALPCTDGCTPYGLGLISAPAWSTALQVVFAIVQATAMAACVVGLVQRHRAATGWWRTALRPVVWFGGAYAVIGLVLMLPVLTGIDATLPSIAEPLLIIRRLLLPLAIGAGMIMVVILQRQAMRAGLVTLADAGNANEVEDAVQRLVGDPDVRLLGTDPTDVPAQGMVRTDVRATDGELLGVLEHRPPRDAGEEEALDIAVPGAALALGHLRTRERLRTASSDERERLERDLHDGAQQHLLTMRMRLSLLETQLANSPADARKGLEDLIGQTETALDELRLLARGERLHLLEQDGLRGALAEVADRAGRDVRLSAVTADRLPPPVEEAVYFICREAMQNAIKHGRPEVPIIITARPDGVSVLFEVSDVGNERAAEVAVTVPRTIAERVGGAGGTVQAFSSESGGRRITGTIPLATISADGESREYGGPAHPPH